MRKCKRLRRRGVDRSLDQGLGKQIIGKNKNISREEIGLETVVITFHFLSLTPRVASWLRWSEPKRKKITKAGRFASSYARLVEPKFII